MYPLPLPLVVPVVGFSPADPTPAKATRGLPAETQYRSPISHNDDDVGAHDTPLLAE